MNFGRMELGVVGEDNGEHTHAYTHSFLRDTQGGESLGQGSDAILTHIRVAPPLIKLMGSEHRKDAVEGGGAGNGKDTLTHTHTQCTP